MIISACALFSEEMSCEYTEINCYRFDYTSFDKFTASVEFHSSKWDLLDPSNALSDQILSRDLSINSLKDSELLIETNPEYMFVLGQYLVDRQKPKEWLFISEQAFLRSWNKLSR
jgi:hypothetical protein